MSAYAIGQLTIINTDWMEEYTSRIAPLLSKYEGKIIAKGQPTQLEGTAETPNVLVTIEFPDRIAANNWYNDAENQQLVTLRQTGSHFELLLVDGV